MFIIKHFHNFTSLFVFVLIVDIKITIDARACVIILGIIVVLSLTDSLSSCTCAIYFLHCLLLLLNNYKCVLCKLLVQL